MIEFYKEVARYRALIVHKQTGDEIDFKAAVYEGPADGQYSIRYSHSYRRTADQGRYTPGPAAFADSPADAESKIWEWVKDIESSYAVDPLDHDT